MVPRPIPLLLFLTTLVGGYVRVEAESLVPVSGRFGGGLGGHGFPMETAPWGPRSGLAPTASSICADSLLRPL